MTAKDPSAWIAEGSAIKKWCIDTVHRIDLTANKKGLFTVSRLNNHFRAILRVINPNHETTVTFG
ncbi:hypothetical protein [Paenibacillus sp. BT-177]|uniref:hypothetical protein n=1 Tax=Paenibacillus sp. BT-177 TaxID=2986930 RepID=UPI0021F7FED9|nr:hypothetical protein [Paenibacillus sp. BT-177]